MSVYISFNEGVPSQVASNQGWDDVLLWADSLDEKRYEDLVHFIEHGYSEDLPAVGNQLGVAETESKPSETVQATLDILQDLLEGESGVAVINGGAVDGGDLMDEVDDLETIEPVPKAKLQRKPRAKRNPVSVTINMPENKTPEIHVNPQAAQITPVINVHVPEQTSTINVAAPIVTVEPAKAVATKTRVVRDERGEIDHTITEPISEDSE